MNDFVKRYWKTLLFFATIGVVGGFFTGIYVLDSYPAEMRQQILAQGITEMTLGLITAVQSAGYAIVLGACGIWLGKQTCLWKDETTTTKKPLLVSLVVAVIGGLVMILPDVLFFGHYFEAIRNSYAVKPTAVYILAAVTYGAVIEEVMLRLFAMSLVAFILHKLFGKKNAKPTTAILIVSNVIAAFLFAAGHLPATIVMIGSSPIILLRCMLMNGGFGLAFGYLYRKYGLRYAMIAHGGCHIVSKLIWLLFI